MIIDLKKGRQYLEEKDPLFKEQQKEFRTLQTIKDLIKVFEEDNHENSDKKTIYPDNKDILITDEKDLKYILLKYLLNKMWFTVYNFLDANDYFACLYISTLIHDIMLWKKDEIIDNPYFFTWFEKKEYQTAWDVGSFWYMMYNKKRRNLLSKKSYILFAYAWYSNYYNDEFAKSLIKVLKKTDDIWKDMFNEPLNNIF